MRSRFGSRIAKILNNKQKHAMKQFENGVFTTGVNAMANTTQKPKQPDKFRFSLATGDLCTYKQGKYWMSPEGIEDQRWTIEYPKFNFDAEFVYSKMEQFMKAGSPVTGFFLRIESGKLDKTPMMSGSKVFIDLENYDRAMQKGTNLEGRWTFERVNGYATLKWLRRVSKK